MKPHKWAKEIHAWADGAEIEMRISDSNHAYVWTECERPLFSSYDDIEYRIKPQPKEPQYLYVYEDKNGFPVLGTNKYSGCIGKIKLEQDE